MSGNPHDHEHKGSFGDLPPLIIDSSVKGSEKAHSSAEAFAHAPGANGGGRRDVAHAGTPTSAKPEVRGTITGTKLWEMIAWQQRSAEQRKWVKRVSAVAGIALVLGGGTWLTLELMPRPIPNYREAPMDEVLGYTLLTEDFNKLPVERRLELIKELIERFKTMSADDSSMMAMFAAGIKDKMRQQLEENAKRLAVDMVDKYADEYSSVPPDEAPKFLDDKIDEFTRMMEDIGGQKSGLPEDKQDRIAALKNQAKRDQERLKEDSPKQVDSRRVAGFIDFLHRDASDVAKPEQRSRVTKFMRDMTRHLRGQDISTGKPKDPGAGGAGDGGGG